MVAEISKGMTFVRNFMGRRKERGRGRETRKGRRSGGDGKNRWGKGRTKKRRGKGRTKNRWGKGRTRKGRRSGLDGKNVDVGEGTDEEETGKGFLR